MTTMTIPIRHAIIAFTSLDDCQVSPQFIGRW